MITIQGAVTDDKPQIKIRWGTCGEKTKTYVFETEEQKAYFMKGVDQAEGWLKYEVLSEK